MKARFPITCLALGLLAFGGCAETGPKVVTDFDSSANFGAFDTFAFSGISDRGHEVGVTDTSPLRKRIKDMIDKQFSAKGLRQVSMEGHPDLLVHLFYGVKDLYRVQSKPGSYGHGKTYALQDGNWVPVPAHSGTVTHEDHEGTLIIDLAESSKQKLVWRGVIRAVLGEHLEKNFDLADQGIAKAFKDYPPVTSK